VLAQFARKVGQQNGKQINQQLDAQILSDTAAIQLAIGCN
jgi:hypothetical protein